MAPSLAAERAPGWGLLTFQSSPVMHLLSPDSDVVSKGLYLEQAEVEMDTMANGDSDLPDTVLGAGVGTGVSRRVHSAIKRGDVTTTGDCQGGNTNR